jgi:hypothetical protein
MQFFGGSILMDEFIAKVSIEHLKQLLMSETDAHKRRALENLLAEEKSKLAAAIKRRDEREES